jgi:hypothetical protein
VVNLTVNAADFYFKSSLAPFTVAEMSAGKI